ncbi:MAG TPA: glycoside hydrolase family 30 beta sandwich domain-containing protein [Solirubrobacteraceae bacterium]|nr:glycoside hydrolase family 30 beta sandwich domain-containing protein [Solirubrobacteraceae bacterium]
MLAIPEAFPRALRIFGRLVAWCAAATAPLLAGGCGGGSPSSTAKVTVDAAKQYQRIAGFGVSEGFGQAKALMTAPASVQNQVLSLLYSPTGGAGLTILRNEISADKGFTIEPRAPSGPNAKPSYLTLAQVDQDQGQLWFAKQIKADYGVSDVFADAWSAPGFMKTNDSPFYRGTVCGVPGASCRRGDWRQAYANYLVQYAKDYAAAGVPLTYVGPQNEANPLPPGAQPGGGSPPQDSMSMSAAQTTNFMQVLGQALADSGLSTRAECCASISWDWAQQYAAAIEADDSANSATALFTSHGYFVAPGSPLKGWTKPVWETEWAPFDTGPFDPAWDDGSLESGFTWAQDIYTGLTAANLGAFLYLWGANTSTTTVTGPNTGLVDVTGDTVATSGRLWAFASFSRFIRPGAVRIGTTTSRPGLEVSAFRNRDGSIAVVVLNSARSRQVATFSLRGIGAARVTPYLTDTSHGLSAQTPIAVKNSAFIAPLPPRSLVSYDIRS